MRVCLPIWEFHDRGGIERSVSELVGWLLDQGHAVEIVTFRNRSPLSHPGLRVRELPLPKLPIRNRPLRSLLEVPVFVLSSTAFVRARRRQWDVVINYGVGQTLTQDVLVATSCHLAWMRERRRVLGKGLGSPLNAFVLGVERFNYRRSRGQPVIAVSRQVAEQIQECYGLDAGQIHVAYPGVDLETFVPGDGQGARQALGARYGVPPEDFWIVFCGYEYQRKGLDVLLRAVAQADNARLRVVVVGDDPVSKPGLVGLAEELGIAYRVHFVGTQGQVAPWFQAADAFVLPTRMDAFGMVVLEAMACGTPAVTTRAAGVAELIEPWTNGYVMSSPEEAEELAAVLRRLAADEPLRTRMGRAARRTALQHTWDAHARKIMEVIEASRSSSTE